MGMSPRYIRVQILGLLTLLFASASYTIAQAAQPTISDFRVTLRGTSTPNPLPDRFGPSTLVEAGGEKLIFDCGRGATIRLWQLKIPLGTVKLFISHLHSDHTVGIPDLWLTGFAPLPYGRRNAPFEVWGPKGTAEMMSYLEKAYETDVENRREFIPNFDPQQVAIGRTQPETSRELSPNCLFSHITHDHAGTISLRFRFRRSSPVPGRYTLVLWKQKKT